MTFEDALRWWYTDPASPAVTPQAEALDAAPCVRDDRPDRHHHRRERRMTTTTEPLALMDLQRRVHEINVEKGWHDLPPRSFGMGVALLHSEVSEALEAWRDHGTADATKNDRALPKPEGFGSELADVVIRCVDMASRHAQGHDLDRSSDRYHAATVLFGSMPITDDVGEALAALHGAITLGVTGDARECDGCAAAWVTLLIGMTQDIARTFDVDLAWEIDRKVAFNRTRPVHHGGKAV